MPHSGWPIGPVDLAPWYRAALEVFDLGQCAQGDPYSQAGIPDQGFDPARLATGIWFFDETSERFAASRTRDLFEAPNVTVLLHANAVKLQAASNAASVEHVELRTLGGTSIRVEATHFVLAAGAIENARILLASDDVQTAGLGNGHDMVGRFFMEHPTGRIGRVETPRPFDLWAPIRSDSARTGLRSLRSCAFRTKCRRRRARSIRS